MKYDRSLRLRHAGAAFAVTISISIGAAAVLSGCGRSDAATVHALEPGPETPCSLDGMILADYPGPKAQIVYERGDPDFFCDTVEMFSIFLKPEQQRAVRGVFVQDMAQADWSRPTGHWIDAKAAFYVAGSKARGSMGPTIASFAREQDARAFAGREGGRVYRFEQVTPEMAVLDGGVLKDHKG
jgi:copper chaperone NosL